MAYMTPSPSVASLIRERMHRTPGFTQAELAKDLRMSRVTVNKLVNGRQRVTPNTAGRLARVLGETARWWLERQLEADLRVTGRHGRMKA